MNTDAFATQLEIAVQNRSPIKQFTADNPEFSVNEGYSVQRSLFDLAKSKGRALGGYKMGLTSLAKQRDVQVFEPIRGFLLKDMEMTAGSSIDVDRWIHPRVEPEVAVVLKSVVKGPHATLRDVQEALAVVSPALEIVDSRFENFSFRLADVVADNCSAAGFMLGQQNFLSRLSEVNLMGVVVRKNGVIVETGAPAGVLGNPLLSVVALANALAREEKVLEPGLVILTGGITTSVPFKKGDFLEIQWPGEVLSFRAT